MKRFSIVVLVAACVGLGCSGFVHAGTDLGQHCFQLVGGLTATLRVSAVQADGPELMAELHARWRGAVGETPYQLLGAGLLTQSHPPTSPVHVFSMGLSLINPSGVFSQNSKCAFHAMLDGGFNGSWFLDCSGLGVAPLFAEGTMTYAACTSAM